MATQAKSEKDICNSEPKISAKETPSIEEAHERFLIRNIEAINGILQALYKSPNHGNKPNPLDELIYINLSKKTNEQGYVEAYDKLSKAYPKWQGLAEADVDTVKGIIETAGLGKQRAEEIILNMKAILEKFGSPTLEPLRKMSNNEIFGFLTSLRGIGPKSALCIMLYSFCREVFPVDTHVQVVSERLGFISPKLDHDKAQESLADVFPKRLRYALHVNMLAHGRKVCKKKQPLCQLCNLDKFCLYYRRNCVKVPDGIPMVDVFCGAGGASLGLTDAGFSVKLAIDNNSKATDTYYLNHKDLSIDQVLNCNIEELDSDYLRSKVKDKIFLLFGGPPCQGWSHIGKNHKNGSNVADFLSDPKNRLYQQFIRQLDVFNPEVFIMENVPGLLSAHKGKYGHLIEDEFSAHSYETITLILGTSNFGIGQKRTRIFFIGKRVSDKCSIEDAKKCLSEIRSLVGQKGADKKVSFRDRVVGLPLLKAGEGANVIGSPDKEKDNVKPHLIFNHFTRKHMNRDLQIYKQLQEGEDYLDFSKRCSDMELLPYATESFRTKFRKIDGNEPSPAIISHLSKDANSYIHPDCNRGITVREGARIQSFPDDFIFLGKGFNQFVLLGNAVPPKLAEIIGRSLVESMHREPT